ncbi:hypothetical protein [Pedobacter gandavensis]|uniref:SMODS-associated and fused to various effectors domain-containing protein n=1 Tax=Pedobacter gandavensis TaxID=2679963 RepID=A0ABR6EU70_9SPHI|nr:hypothetical protein [Pedobacter gandavensis]MBB2148815.1 hypothetical protein [Pedobacter gandavensis]
MIDGLKTFFSSKGFNQAVPWVVTSLGTTFFVFSVVSNEPNLSGNIILNGLGKAMLAGGVFAFLLKSQQFLGVYKDELTKVIFEPKFLKNREDLPEYWEKVTRELVKDKFPHIHSSIMKDVKDTYLPTSLVAYYDNCVNVIDIELIDADKQLVRVKHKSTFTIIPADVKHAIEHPYWNRIVYQPGCTETSCTINSVKVNNKVIAVKPIQKLENNSLYTKFVIPLKGEKNGYNMEIESTKTYSLKVDNIIGYSNSFIQNNFKVQIFLNGVKAKFHECGTLKSFETIHNKPTLIEKKYNGLMYKGQGYIAYLEVK